MEPIWKGEAKDRNWHIVKLIWTVEKCNPFDKSISSCAILRTNYKVHETRSEISITRQTTELIHKWTNILHNKTASIYEGGEGAASSEWWSVACNSSHPAHWQEHYEDGEWWALHKPLILYGAMLSGKRLSLTPIALTTQLIWVGALTARGNADQNRLLEYHVGGSAIKIILRL